MKQLFYTTFLFLFLSSCYHTYMPNMVGGDNKVDVSTLINKEKYKAIYCGDEICELINPHPSPITEKEAVIIEKKIINNTGGALSSDSLLKKIVLRSIYKYTYFMTYFPVDVYELSLAIGDSILKMEIRREKNVLILPDEEDSVRFRITKVK